jgi:hypothetical protein
MLDHAALEERIASERTEEMRLFAPLNAPNAAERLNGQGLNQLSKQHEGALEDGLRIEYWPIDRLIPSARNARTHSAAQVAEIAGSIRTFGFTSPLLVGEDADIVAGHGRLAAARLLGLTEVPVIPLRGLNEVDRRLLMLADNRIALNAGWDAEMLKLELTDLGKLGADLKILGFSEQELAGALGGSAPGLVHEDEIPELGESAVSKPGDIWLLGPHRIGCGDCRNASAVSAVLGGVLPQLMVTDPPYGVEYDPAWRHRRGVNNSAKKDKIRNDEVADWSPAWSLYPGEIAYVWHGALRSTIVAESLFKSGFTIRAQIIWAKERLVMSQGDYHWQHEPCWYAVRKKGNWTGDRKQTTLWNIATGGQDAETRHATQTGHRADSPFRSRMTPFGHRTSLARCEVFARDLWEAAAIIPQIEHSSAPTS